MSDIITCTAHMVAWNGHYVLSDAKTTEALLQIEPLFEDVVDLGTDDELILRLYEISYDTENCEDSEEDLQIIAENFTNFLKDDTISIVNQETVTINGVENRNLGTEQHRADVMRHFARHPFI